jgi:hypothetical protein
MPTTLLGALLGSSPPHADYPRRVNPDLALAHELADLADV